MKRVSLPNANVGTVKISQHKKVNSNEWCYKELQKVILSEADLAYNLCVMLLSVSFEQLFLNKVC